MKRYIVRTSDRLSFKGCRRRWNWVSDNREGWKPISIAPALAFGSDIHIGLETYYEPTTWSVPREQILPLTISAFLTSMKDRKLLYLKTTKRESLDDAEQEEYLETQELGKGMLTGYAKWAPKHDDFKVVATELKFEVPLFTYYDIDCVKEELEVIYQGQIDLLVQDSDGRYWIVDHKTTSRWEDNMAFLEMDEQMGSYQWALQEALGIKIAGSIYNELYKAYPKPLEPLSRSYKGRRFSTDQRHPTSYEIAKRQLSEAGEDLSLYQDYLNNLKEIGDGRYFRRQQIHRTQAELRNLADNIRDEVMDMLDPNLRCYPSPGRFTCGGCAFREPCMAMNEGRDYEWILNEQFIKVVG